LERETGKEREREGGRERENIRYVMYNNFYNRKYENIF